MNKGVFFKTVRVAAVLLVSAALAMTLVWLRPRAEKQDRTEEGRLVDVMETRSQRLPVMIDAYGTVVPRESLQLVAEVRGQVVGMHPSFREGAFVPAGDVLVTIDPRDYELAVRRAQVGIRQAQADLDRLEQDVRNLEASLALARSDVDLTLAEVNRLQKLAGKDMTSQSVLDKANRQYLTSRERVQALDNQLALTGPNRIRLRSQVEMATVALAQAELELARCRIDAPFDAWVLNKTAERGQHLNVGQPVGSIYRAGAFDIEVKVPPADIAWFANADGTVSSPPVNILYAETAPPRQWTGRVARVKAALDATTRTLPVVVEVDDPTPHSPDDLAALRLKPGMFVTVSIQGRQVDNVHRLPRHLIHDGDAVYLARNDRLAIQPVTILRRFKDSVLVSEGLADGDLVITSPISGAVAGMRIRIGESGIEELGD